MVEPWVPCFYLLPKIHKGVIPPPGRPILSANDCPTEKISGFVDFFLRPFVSKLPSYIKDTSDFITKLEALDPLPEESLLVTFDVHSLYTNIPIEEGLRCAARTLIRNRDRTEKPSTTELVQLLQLVLKCNNFEFNEEHYLQISGTAMGSRVAPSYANIFMGDLEENKLLKFPQNPIV